MKTTKCFACVAFLFGIVIVALLVAAVVLLAIVLSNQNKENKETNAPASPTAASASTTSSPPSRKDVVVLVDASRDVDQALLDKEASFITDALVPSLLGKGSGNYKIMLAAVTFASSSSLEQLPFIDASNNDDLRTLADEIRGSKSTETLDIGEALRSLNGAGLRAGAFDGASLVIMASGQGNNFTAAVTEAKNLEAKGVQVITVSLKGSAETLRELTSDAASAFDGRLIETGTEEDLKILADSVAGSVILPVASTSQQTSSGTATTATTTTTAGSTATPVSTTTTSVSTITTPVSTTTTTTTTTTEPLGARRLIILVDASSNLTQEHMQKQSAFISDTLLPAFKTPSETGGYPTQVQIIPFAFDTSADIENYVTLRSEDAVALQKQIVTAKLAKITTFAAPLDELHIGQAFTQVRDIDMSQIPTHVITFASGQGTDYEKAKQVAERLLQIYGQKLVSVALVGSETSFAEISSTGCAINGNGILSGQGLDGIASNIAKCIYPSYELPAKATDHVEVNTKAAQVTQPVEPHEEALATEAILPAYSIDIVVLIDASSSAESVATVAQQSDFIKYNLLPILNESMPSIENPRIMVAPYAFYLSADAQEFLDLTTAADDFDKQLHNARIAPITAFSSPLDELQIAPTLQLLIESGMIENDHAKVLLLASSPGINPSDAAYFAKNITDTTKGSFLVVALDGEVGNFTVITSEHYILNGTAISGDDNEAKIALAREIAGRWPVNADQLYTKVYTVSVQDSTGFIGSDR